MLSEYNMNSLRNNDNSCLSFNGTKDFDCGFFLSSKTLIGADVVNV